MIPCAHSGAWQCFSPPLETVEVVCLEFPLFCPLSCDEGWAVWVGEGVWFAVPPSLLGVRVRVIIIFVY